MLAPKAVSTVRMKHFHQDGAVGVRMEQHFHYCEAIVGEEANLQVVEGIER